MIIDETDEMLAAVTPEVDFEKLYQIALQRIQRDHQLRDSWTDRVFPMLVVWGKPTEAEMARIAAYWVNGFLYGSTVQIRKEIQKEKSKHEQLERNHRG